MQSPGEKLREFLKSRGVTFTWTATKLGIVYRHMTEVLNDEKRISPKIALGLEATFPDGPKAEEWMGYRVAWYLAEARSKQKPPDPVDDPLLGRVTVQILVMMVEDVHQSDLKNLSFYDPVCEASGLGTGRLECVLEGLKGRYLDEGPEKILAEYDATNFTYDIKVKTRDLRLPTREEWQELHPDAPWPGDLEREERIQGLMPLFGNREACEKVLDAQDKAQKPKVEPECYCDNVEGPNRTPPCPVHDAHLMQNRGTKGG